MPDISRSSIPDPARALPPLDQPGLNLAALKLASEYFLGGRLAAAQALAESLWADGSREPVLATLYGELLLLANRLAEAEGVLGIAAAAQPSNARLVALLAETARRAGRFDAAAERFARLGRTAKAARLAELARTGVMRVEEGMGAMEIDWSDRDPLPGVTVHMGGIRAHLLLDTGVGDTLIDADLARRLDLPVFGSEPIQFPAGPAGQVELGILPKLQLGGLLIRQLPVQVMSLRDAFAGLSDRPVDGILGTGLFSRFHTRLDYGRGRFRLAQGEACLDGVPFYRAGEHYPLVEARINDRLDALLFLDTGMTGAAFGLPVGLLEIAGVEPIEGRGTAGFAVGSHLAAVPAGARSIAAAGARRHDLVGMLLGRFRLERQFGFRIAGLLGEDFADGGVLTLDFQSMRVKLTPADRDAHRSPASP